MKGNAYKQVHRIMFVVFLMSILCIILIYLDMISYFSLENIVSMILGFLITIFVQLRFVSYYFSDQIKELDLDEVGVIKNLIKNKIFGEIHLNYINKKSKIKYYQHTNDLNDKLFAEQNVQTFGCVLKMLRAKNSVENSNRIKNIREKWQIFNIKVNQFQVFLSNLHKLYRDRTVNCKKFYQKTSLIREQDFRFFQSLFIRKRQYAFLNENNQYCKQLQNVDETDWQQLKKIIIDKYYLNESKTKLISSQLATEFNAYANEIRSQSRKVSTNLQNSETQISTSRKVYRQITDKIESTKEKVENLKKKIKLKSKQSDSNQSLYNIEVNLRSLIVELDNLQVRKTYAYYMHHRSIEDQYQLCVEEEKHLEDLGVKKFNNKISNYMMSYFDKLKVPIPKPKQKNALPNHEQLLSIKNLYTNNPRENLNEFIRVHNLFKSYIHDILVLYEEEIKTLRKINDFIRDYDKEWKNNTEYKIVQDTTISQKTLDIMFLDMIQLLNKKQIEIYSKCIHNLRQYQSLIDKKEEKREQLLKKYSLNQLTLRQVPKNQDLKELKSDYMANIRQIYQFQSENKIPSCLKDLFLCLIEGYSIVLREIEQKKELVDAKIRDANNEDARLERMNEYKDEVYKIEREQFLDDQQGSANERLLEENSLILVNRLIDVFVSEWKNSKFFHELLKEQIEVSLNLKRPPFLNYMSVKYIKIHQKQPNTFESLNNLSDNIFICLFQANVNFKGKLAIHIETEIKSKKIPIQIRLLVTQFICPLKICFTPFKLGKSYFTMLSTPKLKLQYSVKVSNYELTRIPFLSTIIQTFIVIKLRKKFLYPKKATIKVPLAVKNVLLQAIRETSLYEKFLQKKMKFQ